MWGKVSCLRKQHDGRDWVTNQPSSDLKSNELITTPLAPPKQRENLSPDGNLTHEILYTGLMF